MKWRIFFLGVGLGVFIWGFVKNDWIVAGLGAIGMSWEIFNIGMDLNGRKTQ